MFLSKVSFISAKSFMSSFEAGYSMDLTEPVMGRALFHSDGCYKIPNVRGLEPQSKPNFNQFQSISINFMQFQSISSNFQFIVGANRL